MLANTDMIVALGAGIMRPDRIALAAIIALDSPGTHQGVVDGRDLGMHHVTVGFVEVDFLLHDSAVVLVQRKSISIERSRTFEGAGLDFKLLIAAIAIFIDPFADRMAFE